MIIIIIFLWLEYKTFKSELAFLMGLVTGWLLFKDSPIYF